ncbi:ROK family protein [Nocardioides sp. KIGAM211]|uniref:ROK family protein n=1 Tax=Nocardioides luti TaxID=2761101 RepID=A0A7X0RI92_9ACTN|nr:ROK family protein [Nocardioides luti]MBB6628824.1 ROK family protein [Nocardioides luti]
MPRRSGISQDELRRVNLGALLRRVHTDGPTSRAELTTELGLNRSTIGDLTGQLESLGLVSEELPTEETAPLGRRSGRPSLVVSPRSDVAVVAIALDVDRITVALVGLGGVVLDRRTRLHERGSHDVERVVESVSQLTHDLLTQHAPRCCLGVGVSVPGAVRASDGLIRFGPNLGWVDEPFTALLAEELGMPVQSGNDANLGVLAENVRGAAVGVADVAYISGSVGIGGGFLVGGQLLRGVEGYAGEIGHLAVDSGGTTCRCGSVGCWETKVGENQLLTHAGRLPGGGPQAVAEVVDAAAAGEERAIASVEDVASWTGVGLRAVVNVFNPEVIVLGGMLGRVLASRPDLVAERLNSATLISPGGRVDLRVAALGEDSSLVGAAELAFSPLLADPLAVMGEPEAQGHDALAQ